MLHGSSRGSVPRSLARRRFQSFETNRSSSLRERAYSQGDWCGEVIIVLAPTGQQEVILARSLQRRRMQIRRELSLIVRAQQGISSRAHRPVELPDRALPQVRCVYAWANVGYNVRDFVQRGAPLVVTNARGTVPGRRMFLRGNPVPRSFHSGGGSSKMIEP
jgi:hypothetical protein